MCHFTGQKIAIEENVILKGQLVGKLWRRRKLDFHFQPTIALIGLILSRAPISKLRCRNQVLSDLRDLEIGPRPRPLRERGKRQEEEDEQNTPKSCFHSGDVELATKRARIPQFCDSIPAETRKKRSGYASEGVGLNYGRKSFDRDLSLSQDAFQPTRPAMTENLTALSSQDRNVQLKSRRAILDVLFPKVRAEILRVLFSTPQKQYYVRELMRMSELALCTVQDELRKLSAVGLVTSWSNRYHRFYRANRDHPLFSELLRIVQISARLPRTKHSALHRQRRSPTQNKRRRRARRTALPADRPLKWHLFSPVDKNLTA